MASIADAARELAEEFAFFSDWEERYAHVIDLGRTLEPLAPEERNEENRVRGCASQVWLVTEPNLTDGTPDGALHFRGDSDAHIVRGLIAVLFRIFQDRTAAEILGLEPREIFERLGLAQSLTPQRSNGFIAMIERIRREAASRAGVGEAQLGES
ncbi:MAG: SufE family protein [Hyphomonadaceae bacterium]|nr:SufE family protein [Hyphomonadaceae bacterium]